MSYGERKDVTIKVPPATYRLGGPKPAKGFDMPSPEELIQILMQQITTLERQNEETKIAASTLANVAMCLFKILAEIGPGGNTMSFPKELSDEMQGAQIAISENENEVVIHITERNPNYFGGLN